MGQLNAKMLGLPPLISSGLASRQLNAARLELRSLSSGGLVSQQLNAVRLELRSLISGGLVSQQVNDTQWRSYVQFSAAGQTQITCLLCRGMLLRVRVVEGARGAVACGYPWSTRSNILVLNKDLPQQLPEASLV